jgi:MOSC domain-containing protein YiiM
VTCARIPCRMFAERMGEPHWVKRFGDRGAPGAYLRVVEPGAIVAGDSLTVVRRPGHGVTVSDTFLRKEPQVMARLLDAADAHGLDLHPALRRAAVRAAARA